MAMETVNGGYTDGPFVANGPSGHASPDIDQTEWRRRKEEMALRTKINQQVQPVNDTLQKIATALQAWHSYTADGIGDPRLLRSDLTNAAAHAATLRARINELRDGVTIPVKAKPEIQSDLTLSPKQENPTPMPLPEKDDELPPGF